MDSGADERQLVAVLCGTNTLYGTNTVLNISSAFYNMLIIKVIVLFGNEAVVRGTDTYLPHGALLAEIGSTLKALAAVELCRP